MSLVPAPRSPEHEVRSVVVDDVSQLLHAGLVLHQALERAVLRLRLNGGSWADVGRSLHITKQAAHKRFRHLDDQAVVLIAGGGQEPRFVPSLDIDGEALPTDAGARRRAVLDGGRSLRALASGLS